MLFDGSFKIRDKRVDNMLLARNLKGVDIYYSPVAVWFLSLVLLLGLAHWLILPIAFSHYYPLLLLYVGCGYVICAYVNNSIALTEDTFIVINPNFPFRQYKSYPLTEIQQIIIDKTRNYWHYAFGIFGSNYIKIQTSQKTERYFCVGLELDAFDENWTEETIDTLHYRLKEKGIRTEFRLYNP